MFAPIFRITPAIAKSLMAIEAARVAIVDLPIDLTLLASLRETARLRSTHYSTQIEGNRLSEAEVEKALAGTRFPGRERDEVEVRHYYRALEHVEATAGQASTIQEEDIQRIHGLVLKGRDTPTPYRDGQNVIRDAATGVIVYMPPEASDVEALMRDLVEWINDEVLKGELPVPIVASIAHYQFATIHPYYDGNGRTARLLATLVLHKSGYSLKGIYSLEEYYARQLDGYYAALAVGPSHNYYLGRADADVTHVVAYFCEGMAESFAAVRAQAGKAVSRGARDQTALLRRLDPRQRLLLELFRDRGIVTAGEIAAHLRLSQRAVADLCRRWVASGFLVVNDPSRKNRSYRLGDDYESSVLAAN
jgi:Fic family protein